MEMVRATLHACLLGLLVSTVPIDGFGSNTASSLPAHDVSFFPAEGYNGNAYAPLEDALRSAGIAPSGELCLAHGDAGFADVLAAVRLGDRCTAGLVIMGAVPAGDDHELQTPTLFVAAELDGVMRFSAFAAARHRLGNRAGDRVFVFAAIRGASHHSFASGDLPAESALDLQPEIDASTTHTTLAAMVAEFIGEHSSSTGALKTAEELAESLSTPIVEALKLEGSAKLGTDICNSDFPTNPSCNYPKYPDFALPFGPAPAPSPLPSSDCICGSPWVTDYAFPIVSGAADKGFTLEAADAFHDVSDTHPFHLPHIWNNCTANINPSANSGCDLNVTTLSMSYLEAGDLFPNASDAPLSALELRCKMKSRQTVWEAAGLGKQDPSVDKNYTLCRAANEAAYQWALKHAEPAVRSRFEADGEPFVMVDDVESGFGATGPQWISDKLLFTRKTADGNGNGSGPSSHVEVQSWTFVVGESKIDSKYIPAGMHYCKLLSPARAMEWIYTDGLRAKRSAWVADPARAQCEACVSKMDPVNLSPAYSWCNEDSTCHLVGSLDNPCATSEEIAVGC